MLARDRAKISKAIHNTLEQIYFDAIPMRDISSTLRERGLVLLNEDNTEFSAIFCGNHGSCVIQIGDLNSAKEKNGLLEYSPIEAWLYLSWYKMASGRYEVIGYVS